MSLGFLADKEGFEPRAGKIAGSNFRKPLEWLSAYAAWLSFAKAVEEGSLRVRAKPHCRAMWESLLVRQKNKPAKAGFVFLADKEGFEPSNELPRYTLSKRAP